MNKSLIYLHLSMEFIWLFLTGIIGGLIAGLLGLGGGIFYILVLPLALRYFGIEDTNLSSFVVANSLLGVAFASGTSILSDFSKQKFYFKESLYFGIPALMVSLLSTYYFVHSAWFSEQFFNGFVILLMIYVLIQLPLKNRKKNDLNLQKRMKLFPASIGGGLAALVSSLSGLGGGIIIIPLLRIVFHQEMKKVKIISLFVIFLTSSAMSLIHLLSTPINDIVGVYTIGYIVPIVSIPLIIGVLIGSPLGVWISNRVSERVITFLFLSFVLVVLVQKIYLLVDSIS